MTVLKMRMLFMQGEVWQFIFNCCLMYCFGIYLYWMMFVLVLLSHNPK